PPRPAVAPRRTWVEDEHEEIGRPEGPDDAESLPQREHPASRFVEPLVTSPPAPRIETPAPGDDELADEEPPVAWQPPIEEEEEEDEEPAIEEPVTRSEEYRTPSRPESSAPPPSPAPPSPP